MGAFLSFLLSFMTPTVDTANVNNTDLGETYLSGGCASCHMPY
jgi:hypothetical protein